MLSEVWNVLGVMEDEGIKAFVWRSIRRQQGYEFCHLVAAAPEEEGNGRDNNTHQRQSLTAVDLDGLQEAADFEQVIVTGKWSCICLYITTEEPDPLN